MTVKKFFLLLLLTIIHLINSASALESVADKKFKILGFFSHPGKSHFDVFEPLLVELANRGHDVTVISYFPRENNTINNYHDISLINKFNPFLNVVDLKKIFHTPLTPFLELFYLRSMGLQSCEDALNLPQVKNLINRKPKFDLILTEIFNSDCSLAIVDYLNNPPFIGLSSHVMMPWANGRIGNLDNPSYVPSLFHGFAPNMNFIERTFNTISLLYMKVFYQVAFNWPTQKIIDEAFGSSKPLHDIARNTSAVLVNTHYSLHGPKPNLPNVVEVGGIHINPPPLPNDLQQYLDNAYEGVLFFSWGSMIKASSMTNDTLDDILKVIGNIPRKVIWKWETENLPNIPSNVLIKKWVPQAAILRHPNVKCYLAHGGLLGISEGVSAGVPMVVVPMYGDQFNNAAAAENRGVAVVLKWNNFNAKTLRSAIDRVFNDSSYQKNAKLLQKAWHDRPESPLKTAVWWAEYIARGNGQKFLKASVTSLSWYQEALIDVYIFLIVILAINIFIFYKFLKLVIRSCIKKKFDDNSVYDKKNK
ncbi:UDP-glycosyltransferase UGT5-like [Microplitis mediator]|uniref:UDP-glycosyltransferase UGT5-like n=1 Tax=Microplitis mediator TaxID=375433 RepID=UPI002556F582|nr:UDP-glycosyltransferase UGT5-like [Microplitis mediator]